MYLKHEDCGNIYVNIIDEVSMKPKASAKIPKVQEDTNATVSKPTPISSYVHPNVVCDGCDGPVNGFRYKCAQCIDFNLCMICEANMVHQEHVMCRIPVSFISGRHFVILYRSKTTKNGHFLTPLTFLYLKLTWLRAHRPYLIEFNVFILS